MAIDYEQAKTLLNNSYEKAAQELPAAVTQYITDNKDALDTIFFSKHSPIVRFCLAVQWQDIRTGTAIFGTPMSNRARTLLMGVLWMRRQSIRSCFQSRSLVPKVLIWRLSAGMLRSLKIQGMDCAIRKALTLCCH